MGTKVGVNEGSSDGEEVGSRDGGTVYPGVGLRVAPVTTIAPEQTVLPAQPRRREYV